MRSIILLAATLLAMTPVFAQADADEEKAKHPMNRTGIGVPEAVEEDGDYPIITDEDYPYLDDDFEAAEEPAPSLPQN